MNKNIQLISRRNKKEEKEYPKLDQKNISLDFRNRLIEIIKESKKIAKAVAIPTFSYKIRRDQPEDVQINFASIGLYYMPYMTISELLDGYEAYNRVIREVAKELDVILIERELTIPADDEHFIDTMHFKDPGSEIMAKRVIEALSDSDAFNNVTYTYSHASR